jgi:hypothetical protein
MALIAGILQRLPITKRLIGDLGQTKFFEALVRPSKECDLTLASKALFDTFKTIARVGFVEIMIDVCGLACEHLRHEGSASAIAGGFMVAACAYPQCREKLTDLGVLEIYRARRANVVLARQATEMAQLLAGAVE